MEPLKGIDSRPDLAGGLGEKTRTALNIFSFESKAFADQQQVDKQKHSNLEAELVNRSAEGRAKRFAGGGGTGRKAL